MDPGNWATDIAGGARFGYTLLSVILLSNLMAILLQALAARLGIGTSRDLAQACRAYYSRRASIVLWVLAEIAIAACDLAEVIGSAIALQPALRHPARRRRVVITALDVLIVLLLQQHRFRMLEAHRRHAHPRHRRRLRHRALPVEAGPGRACSAASCPTAEILRNPDMLYIAIGILGATVMPHNLYLHSSIVQTRMYGDDTRAGKARPSASRPSTRPSR